MMGIKHTCDDCKYGNFKPETEGTTENLSKDCIKQSVSQ